jgi:hypothetical protein
MMVTANRETKGHHPKQTDGGLSSFMRQLQVDEMFKSNSESLERQASFRSGKHRRTIHVGNDKSELEVPHRRQA